MKRTVTTPKQKERITTYREGEIRKKQLDFKKEIVNNILGMILLGSLMLAIALM